MSIPDEDSLEIQFSVSGLIDGNLSSPTQGICGIEIEFAHEYIGDLTVTLISPSGTVVQLIGDATTAANFTNLSSWDIDFVPCGTPADPDAGLADVWSNLENWMQLTPYDGTYHPHSGCLEDFNNGPANGTWQIIFEDHGEFELGSVDSITLIFCNPAGLSCIECNPNGGTLSPAAMSICSGQNIQSGDFSVDFGSNIPPSSLYSYEYLFVSGNTILQSGAFFSFSPPIGSYTICGLSYLTDDTTAVNALIEDGDLALLKQAIINSLICADTSVNCVDLEVTDQPDSIRVTTDLCNGEVFVYGGQNYTTDGIFYQLHDGPGLCDTVHEIRIFPRTLDVVVPPTDTLTCGDVSVSIQAMASGSAGPFTYLWSTINGNIISSPNNQTIQVDQAGQYFVQVSDGICEGTGSVQVFADQGYPQVFFEGGTLTCDVPSIDIEPIFIPSDGNILWTGPSGFMSTQPNITVTEPGTYQLRVTNENGCTTIRSEEIGIDTATMPVIIYIIEKNCEAATVTLANVDPHFNNSWIWTGPNMFTTNNWRPTVSDPGLYTLTVRFNNGCFRAGSFLFDEDFTIPDISISPRDTLNCNEIISLTMTSTTPGVTYGWTGPNTFSSQQQTIMISQEGDYYGTVSAPNGCSNRDTVIVELGDDVFDYTIFTDTLTCSQAVVSIGVNAPQADFYDWLNYSGPGDDGPTIDVSVGGNYHVLMRDADSNCEVLAEVQVHSNYASPAFGYTTDTISCNEPVAELNFVPFPGYTYTSVYWELPDFTTVQGPTLMSGLPGVHHLVAVGPNGCLGTINFSIPFDTLQPFVILETDTLHCADTVQIISQSLDSITAYQWSGPGIISPDASTIDVNVAGWYHLSATGLNGCPAEHDILVDSNFVIPGFTLTADTLRCDRPATLVVTPDEPVMGYSWFGPTGTLLSTDSLIMVNLPGSYRVEIEGIQRCIAYDTVILDPVTYPVISLAADTITCTAGSSTVIVEVDIPAYTLAWLDFNNDTISTSPVLSVSDAGPFIASVSGLNACETRDTILVPVDTISPNAVINVTGEIKCKTREVVLNGSNSTPTPLSYAWSTVGGNILSNPALEQIDVRDTGFYYLVVQSQGNGCIDSAVLHLQEETDAITLAYLDVSPPECNGDEDASIQVTDLEGGVGPFQYQLNMGAFQSSPLFDGLEAGTYLLTIEDADQCAYDTTVIIEPTLDFSVDAGPDLDIHLGETASLVGMTNLPTDEILMDAWFSAGIELCVNCATFDANPEETTAYTYVVTSNSGCVRQDEMIVYVQEKGKFYIPNIFSPNGDGVNDEARISASPGVEKVIQWIVFDRWGNAVFGDTDFDPTDTSVFWDGRTSTGEFTNPGVFAYILEFQLTNGKIEVHHGDITVIR